jgi:hypothetical protein
MEACAASRGRFPGAEREAEHAFSSDLSIQPELGGVRFPWRPDGGDDRTGRGRGRLPWTAAMASRSGATLAWSIWTGRARFQATPCLTPPMPLPCGVELVGLGRRGQGPAAWLSPAAGAHVSVEFHAPVQASHQIVQSMFELQTQRFHHFSIKHAG